MVRGVLAPPTSVTSLNQALHATGIRPVIDRVFSFDQVRAAYEHLTSAVHLGKVVIRL